MCGGGKRILWEGVFMVWLSKSLRKNWVVAIGRATFLERLGGWPIVGGKENGLRFLQIKKKRKLTTL